MKILVIDDDQSICKTLELHFSDSHQVCSVHEVKEFKALYPNFRADLLLIDLKLPDGDGIDLLRELRQSGNNTPAIMITGHSDMESPIQAMRIGATDYIRKPLDIEEIEVALTRLQAQILQNRSLHLMTCAPDSFREERIIGHSKSIIEVLKQIGLMSQGKVNVLITGDSGTGKELVARNIHYYSYPEQPFVAVNCSALVPALIESELFGHEKGSFTHALERHVGRMERAKQGTLFLDEIGELSMDLQVKLLRVLQEHEFERVGGGKRIPFQARVISATNKDILALIKAGQFREDLYFRLCTHTIYVPSLQKRIEDIPELVEYLVYKFNRELHKKVSKIPEGVLQGLQEYSWPGNIRELENVIMRCVLFSNGEILSVPPNLLSSPQASSIQPAITEDAKFCTIAEIEKQHIRRVLQHMHGNISQTSTILGISRNTLRKKIKNYGIKME